MTSRHSRFVFAVLVLSPAVLLTSAQSAHAQTCGGPVVTVTLTITPAGQCSQKASNQPGPTDLVPVSVDQCVVWKTLSPSGFDLHFPAGGMSSHFKGTTAKSPPLTGAVGTTSKYKSLTVGGRPCNNVSSLGMVMK